VTGEPLYAHVRLFGQHRESERIADMPQCPGSPGGGDDLEAARSVVIDSNSINNLLVTRRPHPAWTVGAVAAPAPPGGVVEAGLRFVSIKMLADVYAPLLAFG
jgi:hypothetical protein